MPTSEKCSDSRDSGPSLVNLVALKERMRNAMGRAQAAGMADVAAALLESLGIMMALEPSHSNTIVLSGKVFKILSREDRGKREYAVIVSQIRTAGKTGRIVEKRIVLRVIDENCVSDMATVQEGDTIDADGTLQGLAKNGWGHPVVICRHLEIRKRAEQPHGDSVTPEN